jgi:glutamate synthase (NADPH) small chain
MGEIGGFLKIHRVGFPQRDPQERVRDYREFLEPQDVGELRRQGARCMECGVPFCHNGCPLGNLIPDWNDLVYRDRWREAIDQLHATNNFPEFTGSLCPAPCEAACVLDINDDPVTIKQIELSIIDRAFEEGWVVARPPEPEARTGMTVAVVGSGPAGMAAAAQLNEVGHTVTVYERDEYPGGLIRFGVPDFKIEKWKVARRVDLLEQEGVEFRCCVDVGADVTYDELRERHDAVIIATGSRVPRDLPVPGRELDGVHFAMDYLYQRNRWVASQLGLYAPEPEHVLSAAGKHVVVIGGGDTGADCVGNSLREGAASVTQLELLGEPPRERPDDKTPWPQWPMKLRTSYALEEGGERHFSMSTQRLAGRGGRVAELHGCRVEGPPSFAPVEGSEFSIPADLVLLAMGFLHPEPAGLLEQAGVDKDRRGNVRAPAYATSVEGVFAAGDARRGQSLIVWAINEGRQCARVADRYLSGVAAARAHESPRAAAGAGVGAAGGEAGPPQQAHYGIGAGER